MALFRLDVVGVHGLFNNERRRSKIRGEVDRGTSSVHGPRSTDNSGGGKNAKSSPDENSHAIRLLTGSD